MITSVRLQNFRSYSDESFEFGPGVNIIVGPNASGKTNLLEAVTTLAEGSSFRAKDIELVKFSKPWARLDGFLGENSRILKLQKENENVTKSFTINDKIYKRLNFERSLPIVYFEPNHLNLITRGPDQRRDYFDELLGRTMPGFKTLSSHYRRALSQRNSLLKQGASTAGQQLFAWDVRLAELGSQTAVARQDLVNKLNKKIAGTYSKIAGKKSKVQVDYQVLFPINNYASQMVSKLQKNIDKDLQTGFTAYGPHREDIIFYLNDRPANQTASRGEIRSLLLALKKIELSLVEKAHGQKPIFLLDDVFSELDAKRRKALVATLNNYQSILTTTDAEAVLEYFASQNHQLITVSKR